MQDETTPAADDESIPVYLKEWRLALGFKQKDICEIIGISGGTLSKYENDKSGIDMKLLLKLSNGYGLPYQCFLMQPPPDLSSFVSNVREKIGDSEVVRIVRIIAWLVSTRIA